MYSTLLEYTARGIFSLANPVTHTTTLYAGMKFFFKKKNLVLT